MDGHFIGAMLLLLHKSIWICMLLKIFSCSHTTPDKSVGKVGIFCGSPSLPYSMLSCQESKTHKIVKGGSNIDKGGVGGGGVLKQYRNGVYYVEFKMHSNRIYLFNLPNSFCLGLQVTSYFHITSCQTESCLFLNFYMRRHFVMFIIKNLHLISVHLLDIKYYLWLGKIIF